MSLRDHFHPPLSTQRHWESIHSRWATAMSDGLNESLPQQYFAEVKVHIGSRIEVDVATFDDRQEKGAERINGGTTVTATVETKLWTPPAPAVRIPAVFPDSLEVLIYNSEAGPTWSVPLN